MVSYNKDTFILSVTIVSKEKKMKKISVWLRKTFTESYWQMMKCLWQCCDIGTCQNHDHIRTVNWTTKKIATQMLLGQEAVGRLPLDESMVTNTMLFEPRFCFGLVWFFFFNYTCSSFSFYNTVLLLNRNIQSFCRRKV